MIEEIGISVLSELYKGIKNRYSANKKLRQKQQAILFDFLKESGNNVRIIHSYFTTKENPSYFIKQLKHREIESIIRAHHLNNFDLKKINGLLISPALIKLHPLYKAYKKFYLIELLELTESKIKELTAYNNARLSQNKWRPAVRLKNLLLRYNLIFLHIHASDTMSKNLQIYFNSLKK
jgi:hypothetical protein